MSDVFLPPIQVGRVHDVKPTESGRTWIVDEWELPKYWDLLKAKPPPRKAKVCILDTGIDTVHRTTGELAGVVKDAMDFSGKGTPVDGHGHGSSCASICCGNDDGKTMSGVAAGWVDLYVGKVLSDSGSGAFSSIARGLQWAIDKGVDVISMSFGGSLPDTAMAGLLKGAADRGIFLVAAAGNDGPVGGTNFPGSDEHCFCVGAIDQSRAIADFSSRGAEVDCVGAGVNVLSAWSQGRYATLSGTSMATPWVAGMLALRRCFELADGRQPTGGLAILRDLQKYCLDLGPTGQDPSYGCGCPEPDLLFNLSVAPPPPTPLPAGLLRLKGTNLVVETAALEAVG